MAGATKHADVWSNAIIVDPWSIAESSARDAADTVKYGVVPHPPEPIPPAEEINRLRSLISDRVTGPRSGEAAPINDPLRQIVDSINEERLELTAFVPVMTALAGKPDLVRMLAEVPDFDRLAGMVEIEKRRRGLATVERYAVDGQATADGMYELIRQESWIFGGHLVLMRNALSIPGLLPRCLPLVRFDSAIHLVVVESPRIPDLLRGAPDDGYAISPKVYAAFDRARRMVGVLQGQREHIRRNWEFESGRAFVTILIGHPIHGEGGTPRWLVREEIRVLNTFASGVAVMTYDELVDSARQMLPADGPTEALDAR
jgi:hypothetical protein